MGQLQASAKPLTRSQPRAFLLIGTCLGCAGFVPPMNLLPIILNGVVRIWPVARPLGLKCASRLDLSTHKQLFA